MDIRKLDIIDKLNALLEGDDISAFLPLNLYEGHVGLPIDFRYVFKNKVIGYFAVIIDIRSLITPIIESDLNEEFSYRFTAGHEIQE